MGKVAETSRRSSGKGINITDTISGIIEEIVRHSDQFRHIDPAMIHICMASNRKGSGGATFGKLVPLKFKNGESLLRYRGRIYAMPRVVHEGRDVLYIIYFYTPRFLDLSAREKLRVIFHELYHISPEFNGDIRRFGKVKASHGSSKKRYDSLFENEVERFYEYITTTPYINFLSMNTLELKNTFHKIYCSRMKQPRPVQIRN